VLAAEPPLALVAPPVTVAAPPVPLPDVPPLVPPSKPFAPPEPLKGLSSAPPQATRTAIAAVAEVVVG
jgi:hypothetical protein